MIESRSRSTDRRYYGVAEALVVDVNDPARQGRVKLRFPWFDDTTVSGWARVRQLYAGGGYGTFFIPEVDDEVLVAFVHGDLRLPIVLGGLYNGMDTPPVHRADDRDPKLIRTRGGHQVLLDDTSGEEKIEITDRNGNVVVIDTVNDTITICAQRDVTVQAKSGKLTLEGNGVEIRSQADVSIQGATSVDVNAPAINLN